MRGLNILLVEDSEIVGLRLKNWLSDLNTVSSVEIKKGPDSVEYAKNHKPDVILMDMNPTGYNGFDLIRCLKEFNSIMIVLSNKIDSVYKGRSKKEGADYFFDKSNEYEKIESVLTDLYKKNVVV